MPQYKVYPGNSPASVSIPETGGTVTNLGPSTVYYGASRSISDTVNDGSLASGASASLFGATYFYVAVNQAASDVLITAAAVLGTADFGKFTYSEYLPEVTTTSTGWPQLTGPSVTITAPSDNTLIAVMMTAELKADVANAQLRLNGIDASTYQVFDRAGTSYTRIMTVPGSGSGTTNVGPGILVFPVAAGQHVIRPEHRHSTGAGTAFFQKQRLWVAMSQ